MSPIGKFFQQETKKINKMAEGRKTGLRHKAIPIDKKLKIIKDIKFYDGQNIHNEEFGGKEIIENYEKFVDMQIHIPGI